MREVVRVDNGIVHGVRGVDVDLALTEWVLESGANVNRAIKVVPNQKLDQTNRASEDTVRRCVVDCLITSHNTRVRDYI